MFNRRLFTTRFNSATDTKGESITVVINSIDEQGRALDRKQKTISYDYSLDGLDNHINAVAIASDDAEFMNIKTVKRGYRFLELSEEEMENLDLHTMYL